MTYKNPDHRVVIGITDIMRHLLNDIEQASNEVVSDTCWSTTGQQVFLGGVAGFSSSA